MKAFTDISQSKKLAEILPLESADMCYLSEESLVPKVIYNGMVFFNSEEEKLINSIYCWSLAALLSILPITYINNKNEVCGPLHIDITDSETPFVLWYVNPLHKGNIVEIQTKEYDNMIDACVEMIVKLHEQKLL